MPWDRDGMSTPMQFSSNFHEESYANFPFGLLKSLSTRPSQPLSNIPPLPSPMRHTHTHTHTHINTQTHAGMEPPRRICHLHASYVYVQIPENLDFKNLQQTNHVRSCPIGHRGPWPDTSGGQFTVQLSFQLESNTTWHGPCLSGTGSKLTVLASLVGLQAGARRGRPYLENGFVDRSESEIVYVFVGLATGNGWSFCLEKG